MLSEVYFTYILILVWDEQDDSRKSMTLALELFHGGWGGGGLKLTLYHGGTLSACLNERSKCFP